MLSLTLSALAANLSENGAGVEGQGRPRGLEVVPARVGRQARYRRRWHRRLRGRGALHASRGARSTASAPVAASSFRISAMPCSCARVPRTLTNLASATTHADRTDAFRATADAHWDADAVKADVVQEQERRRAVHAALAIGKQQAWDFQPMVDAANSYTRSHMDPSVADNNARFPRPRDV